MDQEKIDLHNILIKQQELLLKQYEVLAKEKEKKEEEINLGKMFSGWFKRTPKKTSEGDNVSGAKESVKDYLNFEFSWKGVGRIGGLIAFSFLKGIKISVILAFIGLALGVLGYFTIEPTYRSVMVLSSGPMPNTYYSGLMLTLEDLIKENSYKEISKKLSITELEAEQISVINYQDYIEIGVESDNDSTIEVAKSPYFKIYVEVKDNRVLPKLQQGLFNYIVNNKFLKNRRDVRKQTLTNNVRKIEGELSIMDSLKMAIIRKIETDVDENDSYFVRESGVGGGLILSEDKKLEVDPMEAFNKSRSMFNEQQKALETLLLLENEVDIVEDFAEYSKPVFPRLRHVAYVAIVFGLFGSLISLILTVRDIRSGKIA